MSVCKNIHKPIITNSENKQNLEAAQMSINSIKDQYIVAQLLIRHYLVMRWCWGSLGIHGAHSSINQDYSHCFRNIGVTSGYT